MNLILLLPPLAARKDDSAYCDIEINEPDNAIAASSRMEDTKDDCAYCDIEINEPDTAIAASSRMEDTEDDI